jgi:hypothetical protein
VAVLSAWRGPGPGRPDLPMPPDPMPIVRRGRPRKRWRYVGVYSAEVMFCAARVEVGPFRQSFWALWDRQRRRRFEHTRMLPGDEVTMNGAEVAVRHREVTARLELGEATPVEALCPSGAAGYGWTRKTGGVPVGGLIEAGGQRLRVAARGFEDVSAGYHQRHTSWHWSAGVGRSADGRDVAWNLVSGINDPVRDSERAVWLEGAPYEPAPVAFSGLDAIEFEGGARLDFAAESERARDDNLLLFRSRYRHVFGTFSGSLDGVELSEAYGVMEEHRAVW